MALVQNEDGSWSGTDETDYSYDFGGSFDTSDPNFSYEKYTGDYGMGSFDTADPNFSFDKYMSGEYNYAGDTASQGLGNALSNLASTLGESAWGALKSAFTDPKTGGVNWARIAGVGGGIAGALGLGGNFFQREQKPVGYTGGIPQYTAVRDVVPGTYDPTRRPGSRGQEYFTEVQYAKPDQVATAKATAAQQATEAEARNKARTAETKAAPPRQDYATGGIATLAKGRYLAGATDGMADKIPATIANQQPAKLSHGEFVIPADVVSHLGNGNSEAGAQRLYSMMDKVRQARTGTKKQGKQINPNKFMPG